MAFTARGALFAGVLVFTLFWLFLIFIPPPFILGILPGLASNRRVRQLTQKMLGWSVALWLKVIVATLEILMGTKLVAYGNAAPYNPRRCKTLDACVRSLPFFLDFSTKTSTFPSLTGMHKTFTMVRPERAVVICNHRTRLDWLFLWLWFYRFGRIEDLKVQFQPG